MTIFFSYINSNSIVFSHLLKWAGSSCFSLPLSEYMNGEIQMQINNKCLALLINTLSKESHYKIIALHKSAHEFSAANM